MAATRPPQVVIGDITFKMTSFRTTQVFVTNIRTQNLIHFQSYFLPKEHYGNPRVRRGFREREKSHEVNKAGWEAGGWRTLPESVSRAPYSTLCLPAWGMRKVKPKKEKKSNWKGGLLNSVLGLILRGNKDLRITYLVVSQKGASDFSPGWPKL